MTQVKIVNGEKRDVLRTLTKILTVVLAALTGVVVLVSHDNPGITGYAVFSNFYGGASPYILVALVIVIIYLYVRMHKK